MIERQNDVVYYEFAHQNSPTAPTEVFREAGRIHIEYCATVDTKPYGQRESNGKRPAYTKITKQLKYTEWSGDHYSIRMGREFQPGRWSILLDFDIEGEGALANGLD